MISIDLGTYDSVTSAPAAICDRQISPSLRTIEALFKGSEHATRNKCVCQSGIVNVLVSEVASRFAADFVSTSNVISQQDAHLLIVALCLCISITESVISQKVTCCTSGVLYLQRTTVITKMAPRGTHGSAWALCASRKGGHGSVQHRSVKRRTHGPTTSWRWRLRAVEISEKRSTAASSGGLEILFMRQAVASPIARGIQLRQEVTRRSSSISALTVREFSHPISLRTPS